MPTGTIQHQYYDNTLCVGCAPGSLKRLTGPGSSIIDLTYDGSLLKSTTWSGAVNGAVSWNYDSDFRTIAETVTPGGSTITYAYDDDNLVTCATRGTCTSADALKLTYHPTTGLLTSVMIGNVSETFTYNDKGELATHDATYNGSPVYAGVFHSTAAPRDNLGRITRKVETVGGVTRTDDYQYDTRGRLLNLARNGDLVAVYEYDDNGNRLSLTNPSTNSVTLGSYGDPINSFDPGGRYAFPPPPPPGGPLAIAFGIGFGIGWGLAPCIFGDAGCPFGDAPDPAPVCRETPRNDPDCAAWAGKVYDWCMEDMNDPLRCAGAAAAAYAECVARGI